MIVLVAAYGVWIGVRAKAPRQKFEPAEALRDLWAAKWDLGLPVLVIVAVVTRLRHHRRGRGHRGGLRALRRAGDLPGAPALRRSCPGARSTPATLVGACSSCSAWRSGSPAGSSTREIPDALLVDWMTTHIHSPGALPARAQRGAAGARQRARDLLGHRGAGAAGGAARRGLRHRPGPPGRGLPRQPRARLPLPADGPQPLPLRPALRQAAAAASTGRPSRSW